jgi:hypothetical protein
MPRYNVSFEIIADVSLLKCNRRASRVLVERDDSPGAFIVRQKVLVTWIQNTEPLMFLSLSLVWASLIRLCL